MYRKVEYNVVCACCGESFVAHDKRKIYCSHKCRDVAYKRSKGQDSRLEPRKEKCIICGKEFETFNATKKTCAPECSRENKRRQERNRVRIYPHTREEINQLRKEQARQRAEVRAIEKAWYKALHTVEKECEECGALFYCLDSETRVTCSTECSKKREYRKADKRIPAKQRVNKISLKKLFKRDNGICYLCGEACDFDDWRVSSKGYSYPGNKYPTIEHVIPVSKGGLDSWDNVRLACWKCNIKKSDKVIKAMGEHIP